MYTIYYLKLRENILANVLLLDSTQKKNFDNKLINALVGLDKVLICESSLEDRIKIMLAFSDFNFQKNLTKIQVHKILKVKKDKKLILNEEARKQKESAFNLEKENCINKNIKCKIIEKEKNNLINKEEDNVLTGEKDSSKDQNYYIQQEEASTPVSEELYTLMNTKNTTFKDNKIKLIEEIDFSNSENDIILSLGRKEIQKALNDAKLNIHSILKKHRDYLNNLLDEDHLILRSSVKYNLLKKYLDGYKITREFIDETITKVKYDANKIIDKYKDEFYQYLLN